MRVGLSWFEPLLRMDMLVNLSALVPVVLFGMWRELGSPGTAACALKSSLDVLEPSLGDRSDLDRRFTQLVVGRLAKASLDVGRKRAGRPTVGF